MNSPPLFFRERKNDIFMSSYCKWSLPPFALESIHPNQSSIQAVTGEKSVIVQIVVNHGRLSLGGHLQTALLAKGGERVVDVQLTPLHRGPQGAKA